MAMEYSIVQKLNDNTSKEPITFTIPSEKGNYKLTLTLTDGTQIPVNGNITVDSNVNTYNLKLTMTNGKVIDLGNFDTEKIGGIIMNIVSRVSNNYILGNHKLNLNEMSEEQLIASFADLANANISKAKIVVFPQTCLIRSVLNAINDFGLTGIIEVGAQFVSEKTTGAFTGQNSPQALAAMDVKYVMIHHPEVVNYLYDEAMSVAGERYNAQIKTALEYGLFPVIYLGADLDEYLAGNEYSSIETQFNNLVYNINQDDLLNCIFVYYPLWGVGTGKTPTIENLQDGANLIRNLIANKYMQDLAEHVVVLAGGSIKATNIEEILYQPALDGGVAGGASIKPEFMQMCLIANTAR